MVEVCGIICKHNLTHVIEGIDEEDGVIILELEYTKEERELIHKIEDLIDDYSPSGDDEEDEEDDD